MIDIDAESLARLDGALKSWDDPLSEVRQAYDEAMLPWFGIVQPLLDAIDASSRLTSADLAIRVYLPEES